MTQIRHALSTRKMQIEGNLIDLFSLTTDAMDEAVSCLAVDDKTKCQAIIARDTAINHSRYLIERECLAAIALHQLVADDLKYMVAAMRIAGELERMGDYASDIASIVMQMNNADLSEVGVADLLMISSLCSQMMEEVLAAYRQKDPEKAKKAAKMDDAIDTGQSEFIRNLFSIMQSHPGLVPDASRMLWISHILERYGDHLTNIAEQVVFATEAKVVELG